MSDISTIVKYSNLLVSGRLEFGIKYGKSIETLAYRYNRQGSWYTDDPEFDGAYSNRGILRVLKHMGATTVSGIDEDGMYIGYFKL